MSEVFDGTVEVQDGGGNTNTTVLLDGSTGAVKAGSNGQDGEVSVCIADGRETIQLNAAGSLVRAGGGGTDGLIEVRNATEVATVTVTGTSAVGAAGIYIGDGVGNPAIDLLNLGQIAVRQMINGEARSPIVLAAGSQAAITAGCDGSAGVVTVRSPSNADAIILDGAEGNVAVQQEVDGVLQGVLGFEGATATLQVGGKGRHGSAIVRDDDGLDVIVIGGQQAALNIGANGNAGDISVQDGEGREVVHVDGERARVRVGADGNAGDIFVRDGQGREAVHVDGEQARVRVGAEDNAGDIFVRDSEDREVVHVDGAHARVRLGAEGNAGDIFVRDGEGREVVHVDGVQARVRVGVAGNEGDIFVRDGEGREVVHVDGEHASVRVGTEGNAGDIFVRDGDGREVVHVDGEQARVRVGVAGNEGDIFVRDGEGREVVHVDGAHARVRLGAEGHGGDIVLRNGQGDEVLLMDGSTSLMSIRDGGGHDTIFLDGIRGSLSLGNFETRFPDAPRAAGSIGVFDSEGRQVFGLTGNDASLDVGAQGNGGDIHVSDRVGREVFHVDGDHARLDVGAATGLEEAPGPAPGLIRVLGINGTPTIRLHGHEGNQAEIDVGGNGHIGVIQVFDDKGTPTITLDGTFGHISSGRFLTQGADCAEDFTVLDAANADPGTVLVIDDIGSLRESRAAYDRRVAGVVSGGGNFRPGIVLDKQGERPNRKPLALIGKAFCKVDADANAIAVGDLLTTSATPGHAMKAADPARAFGAVIGKALAPLTRGRGLIPILVTLQ